MYVLDQASTNADPAPCWMQVYHEVEGGPPAGGVTSWSPVCLRNLLQELEDSDKSAVTGSEEIDALNDGASSTSEKADPAGEGQDAGGNQERHSGDGILAALIIPATLVSFLCVGFILLRHQRSERRRKMRATDEAWGRGMNGTGHHAGLNPFRSLVGSMRNGMQASNGSAPTFHDYRRARIMPKLSFMDVTLDDMGKEDEFNAI